MTSEVSPIGIPKRMAINSSPNSPTPISRPYSATMQADAWARGTKNTAGTAAKRKRNPDSASGGVDSTPMRMKMKVRPQVTATEKCESDVAPAHAGAAGVAAAALRARALDPFHREHGTFIERDHRQRERGHADKVGRRQHRREARHADDGVAPHRHQLRRADHADMAEQRQNDRQLEGDAEGEDQRRDQREIFVDLGQQLDRRLARHVHLLQRHREAHQQRHDDEIDEQGAGKEEHRRREQIGPERLAFSL